MSIPNTNSSASKRLGKELADIALQSNTDITLTLKCDSDLSQLLGTIQGPSGTVYEGGQFEIDLIIPQTYPFAPPQCKFKTPVYHPNISSKTGAICLDTLASEWTPVLNLYTTLLSIQQLLESPEPNDPQDAHVASQFISNPNLFEQTARLWTRVFATPAVALTEISVQDAELLNVPLHNMLQLTSMGFPSKQAVLALKLFDGNVDAAMDYLLNSSAEQHP